SLEHESPAHRFGRVFVASPEGGRGRSFDVVFIPGLAERSFPFPVREDPLLLDRVREESAPFLPRKEQRVQRERLRLLLAVGAAEQRVVFSYPRIDGAEGRPRVPSFYGLDLVRAVTGDLPEPAQFERDAAAAGAARRAPTSSCSERSTGSSRGRNPPRSSSSTRCFAAASSMKSWRRRSARSRSPGSSLPPPDNSTKPQRSSTPRCSA